MKKATISGYISNIERYTLHDGPGIRTTVFLKGCPLSCLWCSNPEMQVGYPQLAYFEERCNGCLRCIEKCPQNAISIKQNCLQVEVDFVKCNHCGECVDTCNMDALVMIGKRVSVEEIMNTVTRDKVFYQHSNGGVTISGGEPLWQSDFSGEILRRCKENQIHTAIQSCGYGTKEQIDRIIPFLDLAIIDLKHYDSSAHHKLTGKGNEDIIENIKYIDNNKIPIVIQIPLIPGFNDSEETLKNIFNFTGNLKNALGVSLLQYHTMGVPKYKHIGISYIMPSIDSLPADYLKEKIESCKKYNLPIIQFMDDYLL
ncbi:MAG: glycyl-radical enzyme activating protein [Pelolinea sp.]|nr:glycyl-radical enzyme activating protein [Pelolinea sp.]